MNYYIKRCLKCSAENHPGEVRCRECGVILPVNKTKSATEPPPPSKVAIEAIRRGGVTGLAPDKSPEAPAEPEAAPTPEVPAEPPPAAPVMPARLRVTVIGLDIPFFDLLWLCTKIILAATPALILALVIVFFAIMGLSGLFGAFGAIASLLMHK
mgnify:CR=1 FL=1